MKRYKPSGGYRAPRDLRQRCRREPSFARTRPWRRVHGHCAIRDTKVTTMPNNVLPRTVDLVQDWGLGADLEYFKELVGSPPIRGETSIAQLAVVWATWVKERLLVRDSQVTLQGCRVEYRWPAAGLSAPPAHSLKKVLNVAPARLAKWGLTCSRKRAGQVSCFGTVGKGMTSVRWPSWCTSEVNHETTKCS